MKPQILNRKVIFLFLIISTFLSSLFADNSKLTKTIRGKVIDRDSKYVLAGANVIIQNSDPVLGASTDLNGNFFINNVPLGRHSIEVIYIGYESSVVSNVLVGSGKEVVLTIELAESMIYTEAIEVTAEIQKEQPINEMASISARAFTVEETGRYAASINDPSRMAMSFAGVTGAGEDERNEIVIRGNSPRGMLWQIEGVPVANPNHFSEVGSSGGGISMISNNILDNSDFMTGAWPAGFGNAVSGVFDINLRKGNSQKMENALQFSLLGADFSMEGPLSITEGSSFLVNYRYSTLAIFDALNVQVLDEDEGTPDFQDLAYKFYIPTDSWGIFFLWGIGGLSQIATPIEINTLRAINGSDISYLATTGEDYESKIGIAGLTHMYFLNKNSYLKSALSYNTSQLRNEEEGLFYDQDTVAHIHKDYEEDFQNDNLVFSTLYNHKLNAQNTLRAGFIMNHMRYDVLSMNYDDSKHKYFNEVSDKGNSNLYQFYLQSKYKINEAFSVFAGLHNIYFELNDKYNFEPRLALKWNLTQDRSFTFGAGFHSQQQPLALYFADFELADGSVNKLNQNLDFTKSRHYAISYDDLLLDQLRLKVELYYQDLYSVPIAKNAAYNNVDSGYLNTYSTLNQHDDISYIILDNNGTGKNYGVELTLEKFFSNDWYFLLTGSLYQSKYTALDGIERDTKFNGNYVLNFLAGKEYKTSNDNILGLNARITSAGGKRDHPVQGVKTLLDDNGDPVLNIFTGQPILYAPNDFNKAFSRQVDDYFIIKSA